MRRLFWMLLLAVTLSAETIQLDILLGLDAFMPVPAKNPLTREIVVLGEEPFHDKRLSRDNTVSCATCHLPDNAFTDEKAVAVGVFDRTGNRRVPSLVNRGYGNAYFWDGHIPTLEEQVFQPIDNPNLDADIVPLDLSSKEKEALRAFLESLSGTITDGLGSVK